MAQRDYVSRGRSSRGKRKTGNLRRKGALSGISKTMVALAISVLMIFLAGLYFLTHHQPGSQQLLPTQTQHPGNGLPPKPEERWRYIKELENRQVGVLVPPADPGEGKSPRSQELTSEQRQLLEQIQSDMKQKPIQLSEVPFNDQTQTVMGVPKNSRLVDQQNKTKSLNNMVESGRVQSNTSTGHQTSSSPQTVPVAPQPTNKEKPPPITSSKKEEEKTVARKWQIQCGSFRHTDQAESVRAQLAFGGVESRILTGGGWSRVLTGIYNSRTAADKMLQRLKDNNVPGCIILAQGG